MSKKTRQQRLQEVVDLAFNHSTAPDVIERLLVECGNNWVVKQGLVINRSTPSSALEVLAGDEDKAIRLYTVTHTNTSPTTLALLTRDEDPEVAMAAYGDPRCGQIVL